MPTTVGLDYVIQSCDIRQHGCMGQWGAFLVAGWSNSYINMSKTCSPFQKNPTTLAFLIPSRNPKASKCFFAINSSRPAVLVLDCARWNRPRRCQANLGWWYYSPCCCGRSFHPNAWCSRDWKWSFAQIPSSSWHLRVKAKQPGASLLSSLDSCRKCKVLYHILASCFPTKEVNITNLPWHSRNWPTCPACQIDASTNVHFQYTNGLPCAGRQAKHAFITGDFNALEVGKNHIGEQPVLGRAKKMVQEVLDPFQRRSVFHWCNRYSSNLGPRVYRGLHSFRQTGKGSIDNSTVLQL